MMRKKDPSRGEEACQSSTFFGRFPPSSYWVAVLTGSHISTDMADVRALRFLGLSLGAIASVVVIIAALTVSEASKTQSQTAAIAVVGD